MIKYILFFCLVVCQFGCKQSKPATQTTDTMAVHQPKKQPETPSGLSEYQYFKVGKQYIASGSYKQAIEMFDKAIKINSEYLAAYIERAYSYQEMANFTKAKADLNIVIKKNPQNNLAYNNLGNIFFDQGDYITAIKKYDYSIKLVPNYAQGYYNRGNAYYEIKKKAKACADWKKAASLGYDEAITKLKEHCQ